MTFVDDLHPALRDRFLAVPPLATLAADFKKGGASNIPALLYRLTKCPMRGEKAWKSPVNMTWFTRMCITS